MISSRIRQIVPFAIPALIIGIFIFDCFTPQGEADWVLYFIPLLLSHYGNRQFSPFLMAAVLSSLTVIGFYFSPAGMDFGTSVVNICLGIGTLWVVSCLLVQLRRATDEARVLSCAVEQSPVSVVITDLAGRISYVNPKFAAITGYAPDDVIGQKPSVLKSGETPPEEYKQLWSTILAGKEWRGTFHNRKKNGELFWESASIVPVFNEIGKTTHFLAVKEDITEQKKGEDALRESESRYRSLFANMLEGFAYCQFVYAYGQPVDAIYVAVNQAFENITGLKDVIGRKLTEVIPGIKEARPELFEIFGRVNATGQPERFEMKLASSGAWVDASVYNPASGHVALVFANITERKLALDTLRQSERRCRRFIEHNAAGVLTTLMNGQIVECNESLVRMLGYNSIEEIKTRHVTDLYFNPEDRHAMLARFKESRVLADYEMCLKRKDGKSCRALVNLSSAVDEGRTANYIEATVIDITDRVAATSALQGSEQRYRQLVENSPDAIFIGCDGKFAYVNAAGLKLFGATHPDQILHRSVLEFIHPKYRETVAARMAKLQTERLTAPMLPEQFLRLDGSAVDVEVTAIPFTFNGESAAQVVVRDITDRKKLESQVLQLQRMENLGMLAGGIAHDLNNVLAPLLFSIELLKDKISDADGRALLDSLETNVQRGASLVKQVLTFGRGIAGDRVPIQPARIIREIRHIIQETFPKSIKFGYRASPDLWTITGDATQLHQVLLNLSVNARDAMPHGGELSIESENLMLDETYSGMNLSAKPGPYVVIKVVDTGTGIPEEIRNRIYDPFFTTKELGKGTGLGLSTTLGIVKSHGGFIHCYSEVGKGSTFKVYLPANMAQAPLETADMALNKLPRGHGELVLVVDDERAVRTVVQKTLEHFGYRVLLAENGAIAISLYALHLREIAVVLTDMAMPIMDGPATMVALLAMNPQIEIIASSGLDANAGISKAIDAGVKHFIPKPYTAEAMLNMLFNVLG